MNTIPTTDGRWPDWPTLADYYGRHAHRPELAQGRLATLLILARLLGGRPASKFGKRGRVGTRLTSKQAGEVACPGAADKERAWRTRRDALHAHVPIVVRKGRQKTAKDPGVPTWYALPTVKCDDVCGCQGSGVNSPPISGVNSPPYEGEKFALPLASRLSSAPPPRPELAPSVPPTSGTDARKINSSSSAESSPAKSMDSTGSSAQSSDSQGTGYAVAPGEPEEISRNGEINLGCDWSGSVFMSGRFGCHVVTFGPDTWWPSGRAASTPADVRRVAASLPGAVVEVDDESITYRLGQMEQPPAEVQRVLTLIRNAIRNTTRVSR